MFGEYAIDPACFTSYDRFWRLMNQLGIEHGRLVSRYPDKWQKMVIESIESCEEHRSTFRDMGRVTEHLKTFKTQLVPSGRDYDGSLREWKKNALIAHDKKPFHAILTMCNDDEKNPDFVLNVEGDFELHPLWQDGEQTQIPREAERLANIIISLLPTTETIRLVDPHFDPTKDQYSNILKLIRSAVAERTKSLNIQIYCNSGRGQSYLESGLRKHLVGRNVYITVYQLEEKEKDGERLHDRYVIVDGGAVGIAGGLDSGDSGQTTTLARINSKDADELRKNYSPDTNAFVISNKFVVS